MKRFGFDETEWLAAKEEGKQILAEYARRRQMITYTDFTARLSTIQLEPHDFQLAGLLGEISAEESTAGRGMLSALVVHKIGDFQPGPGFFELARQLGHKFSDVEKFWVQEIKKIYAAWAGSPAQ
jgi:hypothetical protein